MKLPSFIKINNYSRFEFKPRYYDERKERIDNLKAKYNGENNKEVISSRITGSFKKNSKKKSGIANTRLFAIIMGLSVFAGYLIFGAELFHVIIQFF